MRGSILFLKISFIVLCFLFFNFSKGQEKLIFNFEDTTLAGWIQHPDFMWAVTSINAIDSSYSLQHVFDNTEASHNQISYPLTNLRLSEDTTVWRFKVRHAYNPSSSNNWAFYLVSDQSAGEMYPSGNANGYVVGVNYLGSDDFIKIWRTASGGASVIISSALDWEDKIGISNSAAIEVIRTPEGVWQLNFDTTGSFEHFYSLGTAADITYTEALYFGIYYKYSSAQDRKLWIDDISVEGAFIEDTLSPVIDTVYALSENQLYIQFSELLSDSCLPDSQFCFVDQGIGFYDSIQSISSKEFIIYFSSSFHDETWHELSIFNTCDRYGNCVDTLSSTFYYYTIKPYSVIINEIMADPEPVVGLPEYEYIELLNICEHPVDLSEWTLSLGSRTLTFTNQILQPDSFIIICHKDAVQDFIEFGEATGLLTAISTLANSGTDIILKDKKDTIIDMISYNKQWYHDQDKEEGGWSLEKIDPANQCSGMANWSASVDVSGGSPGTINSIKRDNIDMVPPAIQTFEVLDTNILQLTFSEEVTLASMFEKENYSVINMGNPDSVIYVENNVRLYYSESWISGIYYTLSILNIEDNCGNVMVNDTIGFFYYRAQPNDVVINEVMVDPEPVVGLPEYEYIELYNKCDHPVIMNNWSVNIGDKVIRIPSFVLNPDSFVLLCHNEAVEPLAVYRHTLGVLSSYTVLTNSGQTITLKDIRGCVINEISYSTNWYQDADKKNGGWSLERINPDNDCGILSNWSASVDLSGGTPGSINSIYQLGNIDTIPPYVVSMEITSDQSLLLKMSESEEVVGITETHNYWVSGGIGSPDTVIVIEKGVELLLKSPFKLNIKYTLIINSLVDYCYNWTETDSLTFIYEMPQKYEIVINEIMADPDPQVGLPEAEYIEIFNNSGISTNLKNWKLCVGPTEVDLPEYVFTSDDYLILCDINDTSHLSQYGHYVGIKSFPPLKNSGQTIVLKNPMGELIHTVSYSTNRYETEFKSEGGWSLEMIDINNPCGPENWQESIDNKGGTPGQANSVVGSNPDNDFPILINAVLIGDTTLVIQFDEPIDSLSACNPQNYMVDHDIGHPVNIQPIYPDYSKILLWFGFPFTMNTSYTLSVEGSLCDCAGNVLSESQEVQFAIPDSIAPLDIIINEVLFNPKADGVDFVEIYNNSDKIMDISELLIGKRTDLDIDAVPASEGGKLLFPFDYFVFTINPDKLMEEYWTPNPYGIWEVKDLPNFNNETDEVILMTKATNMIDAFAYNEDMHYPLLVGNEGVSLERISFERTTNDASNWHSASEMAGYATPAYKNSQHLDSEDINDGFIIEPEVFSPNNDGIDDVLSIQFSLNEAGYKVSIVIYNGRGQEVCNIANNELLGTNGAFTWNGVNETGQKVKMGMYIVYIELVALNGDVKKMKKVCVVGGEFN